MEFEWDENKRLRTIEERGIDLLYAALIFEGEVITGPDDRKDYGELREISVGMVDNECFIVVHTRRGDVVRLITAWKGSRRDRANYQASIARRAQEAQGTG